MPRLRNSMTGAVVSVSDGTASRLGAEWMPVDAPAPKTEPKPAPVKRRTSRK